MSTRVDLIGAGAIAVMTLGVVLVPIISESPLRTVITGVFLFMIPGYATIAVLFPESETRTETETVETTRIDSFERIVLSIPLSLIIVATVGLILSFSPLGFTLGSVLLTLCIATIISLITAHLRRRAIGEEAAYTPIVEITSLRTAFSDRINVSSSSYQSASVITAIILIFTVTAGVGYLFATPGQGEAYTELYVLNTSGGEYPQDMTVNEPEQLRVGISNHEYHSVQYTLIGELQRVNRSNGQFRVVERQRLGENSISINPNQTWEREDQFRPQIQGDRLRLIYYLYQNTPPQNPTTETAAQEVHLWVNVTAS
jgi:uncharacterized membrane protein